MLYVLNVSPDGTPADGPNLYHVKINERTIAEFTHDRRWNGAAECLRAAADALDECRAEDRAEALLEVMKLLSDLREGVKHADK